MSSRKVDPHLYRNMVIGTLLGAILIAVIGSFASEWIYVVIVGALAVGLLLFAFLLQRQHTRKAQRDE